MTSAPSSLHGTRSKQSESRTSEGRKADLVDRKDDSAYESASEPALESTPVADRHRWNKAVKEYGLQTDKEPISTDARQYSRGEYDASERRRQCRTVINNAIAVDVAENGLDRIVDSHLQDERARNNADVSNRFVLLLMQRDNSKLEGPDEDPGWTPDDYEQWIGAKEGRNGTS